MAEYLELQRTRRGDLNIGRWNADYPDADNFVHTLLHSDSGFLGRFVGNAEIDALAERGRAETDPRVRHSIYRQRRGADRARSPAAAALPRPGLLLRPAGGRRADLRQPGGNPVVDYENLSIRR